MPSVLLTDLDIVFRRWSKVRGCCGSYGDSHSLSCREHRLGDNESAMTSCKWLSVPSLERPGGEGQATWAAARPTTATLLPKLTSLHVTSASTSPLQSATNTSALLTFILLPYQIFSCLPYNLCPPLPRIGPLAPGSSWAPSVMSGYVSSLRLSTTRPLDPAADLNGVSGLSKRPG